MSSDCRKNFGLLALSVPLLTACVVAPVPVGPVTVSGSYYGPRGSVVVGGWPSSPYVWAPQYYYSVPPYYGYSRHPGYRPHFPSYPSHVPGRGHPGFTPRPHR